MPGLPKNGRKVQASWVPTNPNSRIQMYSRVMLGAWVRFLSGAGECAAPGIGAGGAATITTGPPADAEAGPAWPLGPAGAATAGGGGAPDGPSPAAKKARPGPARAGAARPAGGRADRAGGGQGGGRPRVIHQRPPAGRE